MNSGWPELYYEPARKIAIAPGTLFTDGLDRICVGREIGITVHRLSHSKNTEDLEIQIPKPRNCLSDITHLQVVSLTFPNVGLVAFYGFHVYLYSLPSGKKLAEVKVQCSYQYPMSIAVLSEEGLVSINSQCFSINTLQEVPPISGAEAYYVLVQKSLGAARNLLWTHSMNTDRIWEKSQENKTYQVVTHWRRDTYVRAD